MGKEEANLTTYRNSVEHHNEIILPGSNSTCESSQTPFSNKDYNISLITKIHSYYSIFLNQSLTNPYILPQNRDQPLSNYFH